MAIIVDNFTAQPHEGLGLIFEMDYTGGPGDQPVYIGWAEPDSATSEPVWKISKQFYSGSNLIRRLWALDPLSRKALFNQVWDDRASLIYG